MTIKRFCFAKRFLRKLPAFALLLSLLFPTPPASAEVMLQWFESDWDEMYRRMPEAAEIGYDFLWIPPPTKGPTGTGTIWANVGYNLYDRFDIGDVPQRGSLETRYGSRGSLRCMVDAAHALDIKIIPDIVMNHNGNGPDFTQYPGMRPEDFHVQWQENYVNDLDYIRGPRMDQWTPDNGFGGTLWQELAQLIDIRTEDNFDAGRFTGGNNTPGWNLVAGTSPLRHPAQFERYPYYPAGYTNENSVQMLNRWIAWLGQAMNYDGLRIDAAKHTPHEFFGTRGSGFLHEAQWGHNQRFGFSDSNNDEADQLFENYLAERDDSMIFAEILSGWSEIEYWYGYGTNDRNPMRFLDYAMKKTADANFNGDLNGLGGFGSDFGPNNGITYVWGHDEGPPGKVDLAYAYILTHVGLPMVYFTANNISWENHGRAPYDPNQPNKNKTWMIPGYDSQGLGDLGNGIPNLVWIHQNFARGSEQKLWEGDGDFFALERYEDPDNNGRESGDALLVVALNDSGAWQTRNLCTSFEQGTVLKDYTGNNPADITVGVSGCVDVSVPPMDGQGWVAYAPKIAEPLNVTFTGGTTTQMDWIIPGGVHAPDKPRQFTRITSSNITVDVTFSTPGGPADNAMVKWGQGKTAIGTGTHFSNVNDVVVGKFEEMTPDGGDASHYTLAATLSDAIPEGLNVVKVRVFNQRTVGQYPALFNTKTEVVYVDRHGPDLDITQPTEGEVVAGDAVMVIRNPDFTAYEMFVGVNGVTNRAHQIMKGLYKISLVGLPLGPQAITIRATEADWGDPRQLINSTTTTRNITVVANPNAIGLNHVDGQTNELPFFATVVSAPGASDVRLYWDGYRLPFNNGAWTNLFNGEVVRDDGLGTVVQETLWGAFVNGPHFFEAERVDGGVTSRVAACVTFNLFGGNHIDSDGDGLPDNVEVPFFDQGAPGPDQALPGDDNDFVPESWETWTRLNPYNHSTFYNGQYDDQNDFDGDGYNNYDEVFAGYLEDGNIYKYNIYDGNDHPTGVPFMASTATWTPPTGVMPGAALTITYHPEGGSLSAATQIVAHVGHSVRTETQWQDVIGTNMTFVGGGAWQVSYMVPSNATSVDFTFWDGDSTWDGNDWQALVVGDTNRFFAMNGEFDAPGYLVSSDSGGKMPIYAACKGSSLYVATTAAGGFSDDRFLFVTDTLGDAHPAPWAKSGQVFFDTSTKPFMGGEGDGGFEAWHNVVADIANWPNAMEGELNLIDAFGSVPEAVYVAAVSYGTADGSGVTSQGPAAWDADNEIQIMEFLRVPLNSVRDENLDGHFDGGSPTLQTVVGSETNDANYGLRRFFINERAGETATVTLLLRPNAGAGNTLSDVELISNVNRRDFARIEEDLNTVSPQSDDTYYRAYPMQDMGNGLFAYTLTINKCGVYRVNARYRVNGGAYTYYRDNGMRRDCVLVISPRKALDVSMYEMNPLVVEATNDTFFGRSTFDDMYMENIDRPDIVNTNHFLSLGINMIWLQPIHPIGSDNRGIDPLTAQQYDPGSPYAVRNYWKVSQILGDPASDIRALQEFQSFVEAMDDTGVGVMLDGTFNHSAWDCEIGEVAVDLFSWATNATDLIRDVRPQWYSKRDDYGQRAGYYFSANNTDIAAAPDRIDFGKWSDAADFNFGRYDTLVQNPASDANNASSSAWHSRFLLEEDRFEGHDVFSRELWEYFAQYPLYWLAKTGHPEGTPTAMSHKGIDGLRCDFAQGLPNEFWEYCINRTRSVKWDFLFMAESLDGFREVDGSKRHGVGYRSSRQFDILNENFVFYWRNQFFDYPERNSPDSTTLPTKQAFDERRQAFDGSPILLNLTSHDEIFPTHDPYRLLQAYAEVATLDGAPMIFYGQEAGALNDVDTYGRGGEIPNANNNFDHYEINFGKSIPNFKRFNSMTSIWQNRDWLVQGLYGRINRARAQSPALRSQGLFFLADDNTGTENPAIFAVAKFEQAGVSASTQDVVFCFVNNNHWTGDGNGEDVQATFRLNPTLPSGANWFGIEASKTYNIVDLVATNPLHRIWGTDRTGQDLIDNGIFVRLNTPVTQGGQMQYLRLIDVNASYPDQDNDGVSDYTDWDDDNDGLPDWWELLHGLDPNSATGIDGAAGDKDGDGVSNIDEYRAGTAPNSLADVLEIKGVIKSGGQTTLSWPAREGRRYRVLYTDDLMKHPPQWQSSSGYRTALSNDASHVETTLDGGTNRYFRIEVRP